MWANVNDAAAGGESVPRYSVRAVQRTVQLLEALAAAGGRPKTLSDLARQAGMPEPSALRYLATLTRLGLAEQQGGGAHGRYQPGIGLFVLAEHSFGKPDVRAVALPKMRCLLNRYQETVNLAAFRQHRLVIVEVLEGLRSIRQGARVGDEDRLRSTALGKAILATLPEEKAFAMLAEENLGACTPNTIVSDSAMQSELRAIRQRGYAIDDEESEIGLRCAGVAVAGRHGTMYGLSVSGPSHLFSLEVALGVGPVLVEAGREIAGQLTPAGAIKSWGLAPSEGPGITANPTKSTSSNQH